MIPISEVIMGSLSNIIHVGRRHVQGGSFKWLFLRKITPHSYTWYEQHGENFEAETSLTAPTIREAIRLAHREWKDDSFRTLFCGYRYPLPERDEHGQNALFYQMIASLSSMNGIYFDEELGCNCFIQNASQEARTLWEHLKVHEKK